MKVLIACGGTGGHLYPGLAVAETLLARRHTVKLLVSEKAVDQTVLAGLTCSSGRCALDVQPVSAMGYSGSRQLIRFCIRLARATRDCASVCNKFQPDVVLGMGGFTTAPAMVAARWFGRHRAATLIHESNAVPGKANRWVGRFVDHVALGLTDCARFFDGRHVSVTGTPVRDALRRGRVADAREQLGLRSGRLTVAVIGGSQGARALNETVVGALPLLTMRRDEVQFVHLTGPHDEGRVREAYTTNAMTAKVMGFCGQMELVYSTADVVVARAGAATLTEIAAFGLPAVLVPYPHAAGNHQWHNARQFERAGAACLLEETKAGMNAGRRMAQVMTGLLDDASRRQRMAAAARALAVEDAAERITDLLERYGDTTAID